MATKKDAYVEKLMGNIAVWTREIDEIQAKAAKAKDDVLVEIKKQVEEMKAKRLALEGKMADLQKASEEAWEEVKGGVDVARQILGQAVKSAKEKFNS
jgi:predicted  nucleic acid-binding Zn-ribbon protein